MVTSHKDVTVVIPHIPKRAGYLKRALNSVIHQTELPMDVIVVTDVNHDGAAVTRNRGLKMVETEYVAFLDDDDYLYSDHIETCLYEGYGADVIYPWFDVLHGTDPLGMFGKPFDAAHLEVSNFIPVTVIARTEMLRDVGGFTPHPDAAGHPNEDWGCWLAVHRAGGVITHVPHRTWVWDHASGNTSGRGDRW